MKRRRKYFDITILNQPEFQYVSVNTENQQTEDHAYVLQIHTLFHLQICVQICVQVISFTLVPNKLFS